MSNPSSNSVSTSTRNIVAMIGGESPKPYCNTTIEQKTSKHFRGPRCLQCKQWFMLKPTRIGLGLGKNKTENSK